MRKSIDQRNLQALEKIDGLLKVAKNLKDELANELQNTWTQDVKKEQQIIMLGLLVENLENYRVDILTKGLDAFDEKARNDYESTLYELDRITEAAWDF